MQFGGLSGDESGHPVALPYHYKYNRNGFFANIQQSSSIYQIPNTEHMAYRLVRTLVYTRGVGFRETV